MRRRKEQIVIVGKKPTAQNPRTAFSRRSGKES